MQKYIIVSLVAVGIFGALGFGIASAYGSFEKSAERLQVRFDKMVDNGKLTEEQAQEKIDLMKQYHEKMLEEKASILGLSTGELKAMLEEGKTFKEIADEVGFDLEQFRKEMKEQRTEHLTERINKMIEDGKITQEQADEKLVWMEEHKGGLMKGKMFGLGCGKTQTSKGFGPQFFK